MDYIILDIEFNGRKFASELPMEVIEIGAVRLNEALEAVDEFSALIKPVYFSKLNSFIKKKTGIPQEDIDSASGFVPVIRSFLAWLGRSESCRFVTWGGEDFKRIVLDTRMHKLDDAYWMSAVYYDLLKIYLRSRGLTNDVSVEAALEELGIPSEGSAHRALDDARMTAEIFRKTFAVLDPEKDAKQYKDTFSNAKERRTVKNAIRLAQSQKFALNWELLTEHVLAGKIDLADPRKAAELKAYFEAETAKPPKPSKPRSAERQGQSPEGGTRAGATDAATAETDASEPGSEDAD
ncbi:Inhibitor of the KinA pathway to sporulation, predicted exonuclease [Cohnella sp. OV330]|uniref:3'-5' exonuclease n=1 Tax=Cohnella sp. OV330 TaxID=1855288 RepID=UPI0008F30F2A|nr:3'-5' exonuclease [Cohnella sp. OV330]SFB59201.1 Inhibitor of the KinA pathway to sporulation, predicted exonuclease [Cohnella sp. OV330]